MGKYLQAAVLLASLYSGCSAAKIQEDGRKEVRMSEENYILGEIRNSGMEELERMKEDMSYVRFEKSKENCRVLEEYTFLDKRGEIVSRATVRHFWSYDWSREIAQIIYFDYNADRKPDKTIIADRKGAIVRIPR